MSAYKYPKEIYQDDLDREWTVLSLVKFPNPDDETGTRGSLYKLAMLNSPKISHIGKTLIRLNW